MTAPMHTEHEFRWPVGEVCYDCHISASEAYAQLAAREEVALDMATRAAKTLMEIAGCDIDEPHTGLTWAMNEARLAIEDMRTMEEVTP